MSFHFSADFRGARLFLKSKSNSSRFFALDGQILRSVRPFGLIKTFFFEGGLGEGLGRVWEVLVDEILKPLAQRGTAGGLRSAPRRPTGDERAELEGQGLSSIAASKVFA